MTHLPILSLSLRPLGLAHIVSTLAFHQRAPLVVHRVPQLEVMPRRDDRSPQLLGASPAHAPWVKGIAGVHYCEMLMIGPATVLFRE